jgi:hypothetical protein
MDRLPLRGAKRPDTSLCRDEVASGQPNQGQPVRPALPMLSSSHIAARLGVLMPIKCLPLTRPPSAIGSLVAIMSRPREI